MARIFLSPFYNPFQVNAAFSFSLCVHIFSLFLSFGPGWKKMKAFSVQSHRPIHSTTWVVKSLSFQCESPTGELISNLLTPLLFIFAAQKLHRTRKDSAADSGPRNLRDECQCRYHQRSVRNSTAIRQHSSHTGVWSVWELASEAGKDAPQAACASPAAAHIHNSICERGEPIQGKEKKHIRILNMDLNIKYMNVWVFFPSIFDLERIFEYLSAARSSSSNILWVSLSNRWCHSATRSSILLFLYKSCPDTLYVISLFNSSKVKEEFQRYLGSSVMPESIWNCAYLCLSLIQQQLLKWFIFIKHSRTYNLVYIESLLHINILSDYIIFKEYNCNRKYKMNKKVLEKNTVDS